MQPLYLKPLTQLFLRAHVLTLRLLSAMTYVEWLVSDITSFVENWPDLPTEETNRAIYLERLHNLYRRVRDWPESGENTPEAMSNIMILHARLDHLVQDHLTQYQNGPHRQAGSSSDQRGVAVPDKHEPFLRSQETPCVATVEQLRRMDPGKVKYLPW